jgi:chaperonin GroES
VSSICATRPARLSLDCCSSTPDAETQQQELSTRLAAAAALVDDTPKNAEHSRHALHFVQDHQLVRVCREEHEASSVARSRDRQAPRNETKTASGIVIPDNAAEKPDQGEVLAVGPGKRNDKGDFVALNVKVGDRVLFGKYSGQTVKVDGDELLVMREEDLFAVVEK